LVQGLDDEQRCDHGKECDREVLAEDGNNEEDLNDLPLGLLIEALDLGLPEHVEEDVVVLRCRPLLLLVANPWKQQANGRS
jgi:hypothetical protein